MPNHTPVVFVVDDRATIFEYLARVLGELGARMESAENLPDAQEKLEVLREQPRAYSLLLLDVMFPALSPDSDDPLPPDYVVRSEGAGIELARYVRETLKIPKEVLPIVFFTIRDDEKMRTSAGELDAHYFIKDPEQSAAAQFRASLKSILDGQRGPDPSANPTPTPTPR